MKKWARQSVWSAGLAAGVAWATSLFADVARAEAVPPGSLIVGAERIMGVGVETVSTSETEAGVTQEQRIEATTIALFGQGRFTAAGLGPSLIPRLSFDGVLDQGVTLGGSFVYTRSSGETEEETSQAGISMTTSDDSPTLTWLSIHPRVGFVANLSDAVAIWPRAGITYSSLGIESESTSFIGGVETTVTSEATISFTELSLELLFVASPVPHAAFVFGPYLDYGLSGDAETEQSPSTAVVDEPDIDIDYTSYGIVAGLALVF